MPKERSCSLFITPSSLFSVQCSDGFTLFFRSFRLGGGFLVFLRGGQLMYCFAPVLLPFGLFLAKGFWPFHAYSHMSRSVLFLYLLHFFYFLPHSDSCLWLGFRWNFRSVSLGFQPLRPFRETYKLTNFTKKLTNLGDKLPFYVNWKYMLMKKTIFTKIKSIRRTYCITKNISVLIKEKKNIITEKDIQYFKRVSNITIQFLLVLIFLNSSLYF